ncbi:MAG: glycosyltransferase [Candidatus Magasanikbacteria bacterium]|jgi:GT2 family glycosyltransferase|nr:glycosyltransferase [Candidatus Magasanikbacteria bacterium]
MAKLSVQLVSWNGAKYVPALFESLKGQTYKDWKLHVWDNGSEDGMVKEMEAYAEALPMTMYKNEKNLGFAGGHNALYKKGAGEYMLLLNQDMHLHPNLFEQLVTFLDTHKEYDAVSPRLMKWNFSLMAEDHIPFEKICTSQVDSLGLQVYKNRRVTDLHTTKDWKELHKEMPAEVLPVFGLSGALPMYRTKAIDDVAFSDGNMFDELYVSYKEDVDLAYRLASAGKKSAIVLKAVAHHDRSAAGPVKKDDFTAAKNKRSQSSWVQYHSYKNHLITLYKNEYWQNGLLDALPVIWYEGKKFVYLLFTHPKVISGLGVCVRNYGSIRKRRKEITAKRQLSWKQMRIYWNT